jgi:biotin carboxyl carrier protein
VSQQTLVLRHGEQHHHVEVLSDGHVRVDDRTIRIRRGPDGTLRIETPAARVAWAIASGDTRWVFLDGRVYTVEVERQARGRRSAGSHHVHHGSLTAPMPATVRRLNVAVGDVVKRGDILIVLEAMKMELPVRASADGVVEAVNCREGDLVQPGVSLVEIDEKL